jgi:hypothetical protein
MPFFSVISIALFILGTLIIYYNKRLTSEIMSRWHSDWGRVFDIDRISESRFQITLFRTGFVFAGIIIILMAIRKLVDSLSV